MNRPYLTRRDGVGGRGDGAGRRADFHGLRCFAGVGPPPVQPRRTPAGAVPLIDPVAPERLAMDGFLEKLEAFGIASLAVDEAHCISHWGHDFRPEYRQIADLRRRFPEASFHAFTATATERVRRPAGTVRRTATAHEQDAHATGRRR